LTFAVLRALGWSGAVPVPAPPTRLADPVNDAVSRNLMDAGLWVDATQLSLTRDGRKLTMRLFTPEEAQCQRQEGGERATLAKAVVAASLQAEGFLVRFTDVLFYERGTKGWVVIVSAVEVG